MSKNKNKHYNATQRSTSKSTSNNQSQTKSKYFWILFFLIIFWTISGVLGTIAFVENKTSQLHTAYADELVDDSVYTLVTSNMFFPSNRISKEGVLTSPEPNTYINSLTGTVNFEIVKSGEYYLITHYLASGSSSYLYSFTVDDITNSSGTGSRQITFNPTNDNNNIYYFSTVNSSSKFQYSYATLQISIDVGFDLSSVNAVTMSSWNIERFGNFEVHNLLSYIDSTNKRFTFAFIWYTPVSAGNTWVNLYAWKERTYYFSTSFDDNEFFEAGKLEGYLQGKQEFENSGFQDGYDRGYAEGEQRGKIIGATESQNYSFLRLMTSVIDAPIQALTGLFNFDILGVNLMDFVTSIFTLMIIIILIKLCLGGGK